MAPLSWFITGVNSGLGLSLALAVASAGHRVVGTVRNKSKDAVALRELEKAGVKLVVLDVTHFDEIPAVVEKTTELLKQDGGEGIDVLVNNSGYSYLGALEDFSIEECQTQYLTNVWGPFALMKAVLPQLRERRTGTIINVTSIAGIDALPSSGLYASSKFALEGLSEGLQREVAEFGIKVLCVEPGAFRTQFLTSYKPPGKPLSPAYKGTAVDQSLQKFSAMNGKQAGDPDKAASYILQVVEGSGELGHLIGKLDRLPLGDDCFGRWQGKIDRLQRDLDAVKGIARTGYD